MLCCMDACTPLSPSYARDGRPSQPRRSGNFKSNSMQGLGVFASLETAPQPRVLHLAGSADVLAGRGRGHAGHASRVSGSLSSARGRDALEHPRPDADVVWLRSLESLRNSGNGTLVRWYFDNFLIAHRAILILARTIQGAYLVMREEWVSRQMDVLSMTNEYIPIRACYL